MYQPTVQPTNCLPTYQAIYSILPPVAPTSSSLPPSIQLFIQPTSKPFIFLYARVTGMHACVQAHIRMCACARLTFPEMRGSHSSAEISRPHKNPQRKSTAISYLNRVSATSNKSSTNNTFKKHNAIMKYERYVYRHAIGLFQ